MNGPSQDYDRVELVWPGKRTEVERVRLPFQVIERVNDVRLIARGTGADAPRSPGPRFSWIPDWGSLPLQRRCP